MQTPLILVVDHNAGTRKAVIDLLQCGGLVAVGVENGEAALALMERLRPALVLLDCVSPSCEGFATLSRMRDLPATNAVPVIVYCSESNDVLRARAASLGAVEFIHKNGEAWPRLLDRVSSHLASVPASGRGDGDAQFWTP